jgi:hypothetical protein
MGFEKLGQLPLVTPEVEGKCQDTDLKNGATDY